MPGMRVRSTPVIRFSSARRLKWAWFLRRAAGGEAASVEPCGSVTVAREVHWIALPFDDRAHDPHARHARDVAQHLVELHIHDLEGLLHPVHLLRAPFHERLSVPIVGLERLDLGRASEHPREQAIRMKPLQPLAVLHVAFAPWNASNVAGIDQHHGDAEIFLQEARDRHPIDARRLHGHGRHAARFQPSAHLEQVGRGTPKRAHRRRVRSDRDVVLAASDVDPRSVRMNDLQGLFFSMSRATSHGGSSCKQGSRFGEEIRKSPKRGRCRPSRTATPPINESPNRRPGSGSGTMLQ